MSIVNISTYNDADFNRTFVWQTLEETPINLTGGTMEMMLRKRKEDDVAVLRLGTDTGELIYTSPTTGQFALYITQAALERLEVGEYDHSLIFSKAGQKIRVWSGTFNNQAGATR
jgi:hypothetical protein